MDEYRGLLYGLIGNYNAQEVESGVWTHTFTAPRAPSWPITYTFSPALAPYVKRLMLECHVPMGQLVYPGRLPVLVVQDQARVDRLKRRKKIERRQKRAAFRRRKRGLA